MMPAPALRFFADLAGWLTGEAVEATTCGLKNRYPAATISVEQPRAFEELRAAQRLHYVEST